MKDDTAGVLLVSSKIINKTLKRGPRQITPRHGRQSPTTAHPPPVLSLLTSGSFRRGVKYFLIELVSFGGRLVVVFLVLSPGLFLSAQKDKGML